MPIARNPWGTPPASGDGVALPSVEYTPRDPGGSVLYQIVREHFETFRAEAAHLRDGEGLPRFVEDEFEAFLWCGWLAGGFARFRCGRCGTDRLVAFSCKGRGFCASCGGRRMTAGLGAVTAHAPRSALGSAVCAAGSIALARRAQRKGHRGPGATAP